VRLFVDEAGSGDLFDKKGRIIVGTEGCSRFFVLGLLQADSLDRLAQDMENLRQTLLADPYFRKVPSMRPEAGKTAVCFHAKDDVPEVRKEVFALLAEHALHFFAVVKNKVKVAEYVRQRNESDPNYRYHPNELYDFMTRRLFRERLHRRDAYRIVFAKRGKSDRTAALRDALDRARRRFQERYGIASDAHIEVVPGGPCEYPGLQAADYFLWSLQRLYERREDRYVEFLWPKFRLVQDIDDTRSAGYGTYYTQKRPLSAAALEELPGI